MLNYKELLLIIFFSMSLLLIGAVGISRKTQNQMICRDHLHKLYKLNLTYQNDHGVLPPVLIPAKPLWKSWKTYLRPYTKSDLIFCCPSDPKAKLMFSSRDPLFSFKRNKTSSYGMNERLNSLKRKVTVKIFKHPRSCIFFGDARIGVLRLPSLPGLPRHSGKVQYLFGDGHTELKALSQLRNKGSNGKFIYKDINWKPW